MEKFVMGSINVRKSSGNLFFDFRYQKKRCREQTALPDTPGNRKKMQTILKRLEAEITLGTFEYAQYFPGSSMAEKTAKEKEPQNCSAAPLFKDFSDTWLAEMHIEWRESHYDTVANTIKAHLNPVFGGNSLDKITKADILQFRATLSKIPGRSANGTLSAERINHIMTPLRQILAESSDRFNFTSPYRGIKSLKVPKTNVEPFTLSEVYLILSSVRKDFHPYYVVRFFTGLRTGEIDGLQWQFVDFERRQILVRESWVKGKIVYTKNDGSQRDISMTSDVFDALQAQFKVTGKKKFVFCTREGSPYRHSNITSRVWYPLLNYLNLKARRPYQTRHTAATLMLASGENPEWIARQLGHTTTEMLFRTYSRYVPNLTRQDGSAYQRMLLTTTKPKKERV
jgi:integrase